MFTILDWQSDGILARFMLMLSGLIVLLFVLPRVRQCRPLARLLPAALVWHFVAFLYTVFWMIPYYSTTGLDCSYYHEHGIAIAPLIRAGDWANIPWGLGSDGMNIIMGFVYTPWGADVYGMMFLSAIIGLCGSLYFCLAFSLWASPVQTRRYSLIILFLPSFVTWTGLFGKDSWMALGLGLAAFGYSSMLKPHRRGFYHLLAGIAIITTIRPHIAVAVAASAAVSYLWGLTKTNRGSILAKFQKIAMLLALLVLLGAVARGFLGLTEVSANSLQEVGQSNGEANQSGGSVVEVQTGNGVTGTLIGFPRGIVRVLFQPFPWEIHNVNTGLAAAENIFILWFALSHIGRLRKMFRGMAREPYILFSSILAGGLLLMFSLVPNLGILSRERAQLLPFLFALLMALEAVRKRKRANTGLRVAWAGLPRYHIGGPPPLTAVGRRFRHDRISLERL
jgi:hypothetical protein